MTQKEKIQNYLKKRYPTATGDLINEMTRILLFHYEENTKTKRKKQNG